MDAYVREQLSKFRDSLQVQAEDLREREQAQRAFTDKMTEEIAETEAHIASIDAALAE